MPERMPSDRNSPPSREMELHSGTPVNPEALDSRLRAQHEDLMHDVIEDVLWLMRGSPDAPQMIKSNPHWNIVHVPVVSQLAQGASGSGMRIVLEIMEEKKNEDANEDPGQYQLTYFRETFDEEGKPVREDSLQMRYVPDEETVPLLLLDPELVKTREWPSHVNNGDVALDVSADLMSTHELFSSVRFPQAA